MYACIGEARETCTLPQKDKVGQAIHKYKASKLLLKLVVHSMHLAHSNKYYFKISFNVNQFQYRTNLLLLSKIVSFDLQRIE